MTIKHFFPDADRSLDPPAEAWKMREESVIGDDLYVWMCLATLEKN